MLGPRQPENIIGDDQLKEGVIPRVFLLLAEDHVFLAERALTCADQMYHIEEGKSSIYRPSSVIRVPNLLSKMIKCN